MVILCVITSLHALATGCGGSSASRRDGGSGAAAGNVHAGSTNGGTNASGGAGTGGSARGGVAGTGAAPGGGAGSGGSGAATAGAPTAGSGLGGAGGGNAGTLGTAGGGGLAASGTAGTAGDAAGGADDGGAAGCLDLCAADAPMCCTEELHCVKAIPTCRIDVLDGLIVDIPYTYEELVAEVAERSGEAVLTIGDIDVARALTDPPLSGRFELDLSERASELHGPGLANLRNRAFRVSCSDELLFLGLIYDRNGAAAIGAPVMHVEEDDDGLVTLLIGSSLGVWSGIGPYPEPERNARIDRPELRATFCERGVLGQLEPR